MAFYTARLDATYTYRDASGNEHDIPLVLYDRTLLCEPPSRSWNLPMEEHSLIGSQWSYAEPSGNASLSLSLHWLVSRPTTAEAEAAARRLELDLNMNRKGVLTLCEAFHSGLPLLVSKWDAVVTNASAALCTLDEALPASSGAQAHVQVDLLLTNPAF